MAKLSLNFSNEDEPDAALNNLRNALRDDNECYVLITCSKPSNAGKMQVEMTFEGDESLASYLIETANDAFHSESEESMDSC